MENALATVLTAARTNHRIRNRLWLTAGAIGLMLLVVLGRDAVIRNSRASHRLCVGGDFLPVYAAGQLVREGRAAELYDMQPLADVERDVVSKADLPGNYLSVSCRFRILKCIVNRSIAILPRHVIERRP